MRILAPSEFRAQPWKNGGGITHEIVRWPDPGSGGGDGGGDGYDVRISLADDRQAAPFSRFPGYRRWSFLAAAAPIHLDVAGELVRLTALGDLVEVDGDVAISCTLPDGPTRLFNILVRHGIEAEVGRGPVDGPIRFAFALAALPWLPAEHAAIFGGPEDRSGELPPGGLDERAVWLRLRG